MSISSEQSRQSLNPSHFSPGSTQRPFLQENKFEEPKTSAFVFGSGIAQNTVESHRVMMGTVNFGHRDVLYLHGLKMLLYLKNHC